MAELLTDIDPYELTGFARDTADSYDDEQLLSTWFPSQQIPGFDFEFARGSDNWLPLPEYRSFDAEVKIVDRAITRSKVKGQILPFGSKTFLTEWDRKMLAGDTDGAHGTAFDDVERQARGAVAKSEIVRGEALSTGEISFTDDAGIEVGAIDFGRNANRDVAPGTLWSTHATATPLSDCLLWQEVLEDDATADRAPFAICSLAVMRHLVQNDELRSYYAMNGTTPLRISPAQVNDAMEAEGCPRFIVSDKRYVVDSAGTEQRVLPEDEVIFMPSPGAGLGATVWGVTTEAIEMLPNLQGVDASGIVAVAMVDWEPVKRWTKVAGLSLPILPNPDLNIVATVI